MGNGKIKCQYFVVSCAYHVWSHSGGTQKFTNPPTHGFNILTPHKKTGSVMIYKIYAISDMKNK